MLTFSDDDIRRIFTLRSKGKTQKDVGEIMGCSDSHIANILGRNIYMGVDIPENILEACKEVKPVRKKGYKINRKGRNGAAVDLPEAMTEFTLSCKTMQDAKRRCIELGINADTLELIRESMRDSV